MIESMTDFEACVDLFTRFGVTGLPARGTANKLNFGPTTVKVTDDHNGPVLWFQFENGKFDNYGIEEH